jgi:hypothetical protein
MGDLSPHFSRNELACRCCGLLQLHPRLLEGLEALRKLAGGPVIINAGYRWSTTPSGGGRSSP